MTLRAPFNQLILRAVLRNVNPMVIRVISVPDSLDLTDFDEVFRTVLRAPIISSCMQQARRRKTAFDRQVADLAILRVASGPMRRGLRIAPPVPDRGGGGRLGMAKEPSSRRGPLTLAL